MLLNFRVRNFKSIRDLSLNLSYDRQRSPKNLRRRPDRPFFEEAGRRIVPCLAMFGPNGSGKSAVTDAIGMVAGIASGRLHPSAAYRPYQLSKEIERSTDFEMIWTAGGDVFAYSIEVSEDRIVGEKLLADTKILFSSQEGVIELLDIGSTVSVKKELQIQCCDASAVRQIRAILPVLAERFPGFDARAGRAFRSLAGGYFFLNNVTKPQDSFLRFASTFNLPDASERNKAAAAMIADYLRRLDVGVLGIRSVRKLLMTETPHGFAAPDEGDPAFRTVRMTEDGTPTEMNLEDESTGVVRLFTLLAVLLAAVRTGGTAVIDDFDSSLHPSLLPEMIKIVRISELNARHAQIICTLHGTDLLENGGLSESEAAFVSQNGYYGTSVRRLSSFEAVSGMKNFRRRYLNGSYDALPSPYI